MIELRLSAARSEARFGSCGEAEKHLDIARSLLDGYPNLWLAGTIELDRSNIAALRGDIDRSLRHVEAALVYSKESGHFRTQMAALINSSQLLGSRGAFSAAHARLDEALEQTSGHRQLTLAAMDSRANLHITVGDFESAASALKEISITSAEMGNTRLHWDTLTESYTRARLAAAVGDWDAADHQLGPALSLARECHDQIWARRLQLLRVKCRAMTATPQELDDTVFSVGDDSNVEVLAQRYGSMAAILGPELGNGSLARAIRVADGIGNMTLGADLNAGMWPLTATSDPPRVEDAVALLEFAGYPQILAKEACALLDAIGCVDSTALISRNDRKVDVLLCTGWDETQALAAAERRDTSSTIPCGSYRDEALEIIAQIGGAPQQRCAFAAIKKLVSTALTLDQHRRDEKQREALWPTESIEGDADCIWSAEPISDLIRDAQKIGAAPLSVLVTGETGTGKEMLARTIHRASPHADKIMLPFNCTAVPRDMLESQLFGYRRGAFTGADTSFVGVIRAAEGGTLFLDEIADVPLDVQPKLLRFLDTHEVHPLGEPHPVKVDVRVIAATNADLDQLVAQGRFREDLLYRLNVVQLRMPPLRERRGEIPALVDHFAARYSKQQQKQRITVSDETLEYLLLYRWPGNIRQLANEVNRMVAMAEPGTTLMPSHLSPEIRATRKTIATPPPEFDMRVSFDQSLPEAVDHLERTMVQAALDRSKGRVDEAAKLLGISRKGLFLKRRRWGLKQAS
ncbi:MAG: sigma 54-interacting transcriptional regulator [Vicinamibacterales bacterium]